MNFTDERVVSSCATTHKSLFYWHLSRYHFAKHYLQRDDRVLDVACGVGYGTYELASQAKHVVGVDIDKEAIDYASATFKSPNIRFVAGNCAKLSNFLDEKFNVCVSFETLEHLTQQDQQCFLGELARHLVDDGTLIISTPNIAVYNPEADKDLNPFHLHELKLDEFKSLLSQHFGQVFILGQRMTKGASNKWFVLNFIESLKSLIRFKLHSVFGVKSESFVELNDFEFATTDIEESLIFVAVCRYPQNKTK